MPRKFSIPTVLRMVPNCLLRQWFTNHVPGEFSVDWQNLGEREVDPMLDYLTDLEPYQAAAIELDLRNVFDLACDAGMAAIQETATRLNDREVMSEIPEEFNLYGRSMWIRLNSPDLHSASFTLREIDDISFWRKRNDLPSVATEINRPRRDKLARAVSSLLKSEGRGQQCSVETMKRGDLNYVFVYPDDFVRCDQVHDNSGNLAPLPVRPTMQIVFAYDQVEGSLATFARLPKASKEELERLFADCILGWDLPPFDLQQTYRLEHLKDPGFQLTTDPADQIRARIEEILLYNESSRRQHNLRVNPGDPTDCIHRAINEELNLENIPLWQAKVQRVVIQFEFLGTSHRRAGRQKIRVMSPYSCNLNNASPERAEIFQKYLKLWNIDCATPVESDPVAVGA